MAALDDLTLHDLWTYCLVLTFLSACVIIWNFTRFLRQNPPQARQARFSYVDDGSSTPNAYSPTSYTTDVSSSAAATTYRGHFLFYVCIVSSACVFSLMFALLLFFGVPDSQADPNLPYAACFPSGLRAVVYFATSACIALGSWTEVAIPISIEYLFARTLYAGHFTGKASARRRENSVRTVGRIVALGLWGLVYIVHLYNSVYTYTHTPAAYAASGCIDSSIRSPFYDLFLQLYGVAFLFFCVFLGVSLSLMFYRGRCGETVAVKFFSRRSTHLKHLQSIVIMNIGFLASLAVLEVVFSDTSSLLPLPLALCSGIKETVLDFYLLANSFAFVSRRRDSEDVSASTELPMTVSPLRSAMLLTEDPSAPVDLTVL
jgi:hypothetical protein